MANVIYSGLEQEHVGSTSDEQAGILSKNMVVVSNDHDPRAIKAVLITLVLSIVFMKFAPHMLGTSIQLALPFTFALISYLLFRRLGYISVTKFLLYIGFVCLASLVSMLAGGKAELPSFLFVCVIYLMYVVEIKISQLAYLKYLNWITYLGMIAAFMVAIQWACQFLGFGMPSLEIIMPKSIIMFNYVYIQPLEWGAKYMKPNGIIFLEASYISQFMALVCIIEACFFQRLKFLAIFAVTLLVSFGGTGMLLLVLCAPVILFYLRLKLLPILIISAPICGVAAYQIGLFENVQDRLGEFNQEGTSGNMRFTQQFIVVKKVLLGPPKDAFFGQGSGTMPQGLHIMYTPVSKVMFEYGIFVYVLFYFFLFRSVFGKGVPFIMSWAMTMQYLWLNGSFLVPINNVYLVLICSIFRVTGTEPWAIVA
ncbi:MAG: hypothetical protein OSB00_11355, partial [Sphingomonas bacterium]|nr:hypothetical protein [Sphingomonas bacterium]